MLLVQNPKVSFKTSHIAASGGRCKIEADPMSGIKDVIGGTPVVCDSLIIPLLSISLKDEH